MDTNLLLGSTLDNRFELLSLAGVGGLGIVYKAKQLDLDRVVAVKLLTISLLSPGIVYLEQKSRFEREAQALALLSHVNIAMFYGYGIWRDNCPYIVMEFVEGQSLKNMLNSEDGLSWPRALRLVQQACEGMAYVHSAGVVHRDLSPNNIIVQAEDHVKIIDFGLAKLITPSESEQQKLTQTGTLLGTAPYMSPEICAGQKSDKRSDIYSLGCILYECLTGAPPHQADNPIGLMHKHVHEAVVPPSVKSRFQLPNALDGIVLKALAKDVSARYQSMSDLKQEIYQILGEEHNAQAPNTTRKSKSRSAAQTLGFVLKMALLPAVILAGISIVQNLPHETIQPAKGLKKEPYYEGRYKRALEFNEKALGESSEVTAKSRLVLIEYYQKHGEYAKADALLRRSLAISEKDISSNPVAAALCLRQLAVNLDSQEKHKEAESLLKRSLAIAEKTKSRDPEVVAEGLSFLANNLALQGKNSEAETAHRRALALVEKDKLSTPVREAVLVSRIATDLEHQGKFKESEPLLWRALATYDNDKNKINSYLAAQCLSQLANNLQIQGKYKEAEPVFRRSLSLTEDIKASPNSLCDRLSELASNLEVQNKRREAESLERRSMAILEKEKDIDPRILDAHLSLLANNLYQLGKYDESEPLMRRLLTLSERDIKSNPNLVVDRLWRLAANLHQQHKNPAEENLLYKRSVAITETLPGNEIDFAEKIQQLGTNYLNNGLHIEAEALFKRAMVLAEKSQAPERLTVISTSLSELVRSYESIGNYASAEPLLRRSLAICESEDKSETKLVADRLVALANNLEQQGRYIEADPLRRRLLTMAESDTNNNPKLVRQRRAELEANQYQQTHHK